MLKTQLISLHFAANCLELLQVNQSLPKNYWKCWSNTYLHASHCSCHL